MTPKLFTGLAAGAALSVLGALIVYGTQSRWSPGRVAGEPALPQLATRVGEVAAVELRQGEKAITLVRRGEDWTLKERDGYPAKAEKVRALVVPLAQARLVERKTRNPERFGLLELEDPASKEAKSRLIRLLDKDGRPLAEIVAGKQKYEAFGSGKNGVYVRRPGEQVTWLASADIDAPLQVKDWVERAFFKHDEKVRLIHIEVPGEQPWDVKRGEAKDGKEAALELPPAPAGKKLKAGESADSFSRAYGLIELEDVRKAAAPQDDAKVLKSRLETEGGLVVGFQLVQGKDNKDDSWLSLVASGTESAKAKAEAINKTASGWQFKIPAHTAGQLFKAQSELYEAGGS